MYDHGKPKHHVHFVHCRRGGSFLTEYSEAAVAADLEAHRQCGGWLHDQKRAHEITRVLTPAWRDAETGYTTAEGPHGAREQRRPQSVLPSGVSSAEHTSPVQKLLGSFMSSQMPSQRARLRKARSCRSQYTCVSGLRKSGK